MEKRKSPPPIRQVRAPAFQTPPDSCDTHVHIIGPQRFYPLAPSTPVDLEDSTIEDFRKVQATLGIPRALIVASGGHAYSYNHILNLLFRYPDDYRGVVTLAPDVTDRELTILADAGVVGARFYFAVCEPEAEALRRTHRMGWSAHFNYANSEMFGAWLPLIKSFPGPIVLEHTGKPDPAAGLDSEHYKAILKLLDTDRCWLKLSTRFSREPEPPFPDLVPIMHDLVGRRPDRLLYGSDYPHPSYFNPMPNEADFLDLMLLWAPDARDRELILRRNPEALFGFATKASAGDAELAAQET